jgi:hypothetical protein
MAEVADSVANLGRVATQEAMRRMEEKTAALESAALNEARIELEKRGGELAINLQKDRIAGSNYVKDLETARGTLKKDVWATLPARVQSSARARAMFDDFYTADQIQATRSATAWQMGQEKEYAVQSLDKAMLVMTAKVEADPSMLKGELEGWSKTVPTYGGLLDQETIANAQTKGMQALLLAGVRGFAQRGQFEEAEALKKDAAAQLDPAQRSAMEGVIKQAEAEIEREKAKQETARNKAWQINDANFQVGVLQGKNSYQHIDDAIARGDLDPARRDTLYRAVRAEDDRRKAEAEQSRLSAAERAAIENRSKDVKFIFSAMSDLDPARFMAGPESWSEQHREYYSLMTPADQRAVDEDLHNMRIKGDKVGPAKEVFNTLVDEAKRVVPEWRLGSDADPKKLPKESLQFSGVLRSVAEEIAPSLGGKDMTVDQARDAVARALRTYQPKDWLNLPTNQRDVYLENPGAAPFKTGENTYATDGGARFRYDESANIRNEIINMYQQSKGRRPTKAELDAELARVTGD